MQDRTLPGDSALHRGRVLGLLRLGAADARDMNIVRTKEATATKVECANERAKEDRKRVEHGRLPAGVARSQDS